MTSFELAVLVLITAAYWNEFYRANTYKKLFEMQQEGFEMSRRMMEESGQNCHVHKAVVQYLVNQPHSQLKYELVDVMIRATKEYEQILQQIKRESEASTLPRARS